MYATGSRGIKTFTFQTQLTPRGELNERILAHNLEEPALGRRYNFFKVVGWVLPQNPAEQFEILLRGPNGARIHVPPTIFRHDLRYHAERLVETLPFGYSFEMPSIPGTVSVWCILKDSEHLLATIDASFELEPTDNQDLASDYAFQQLRAGNREGAVHHFTELVKSEYYSEHCYTYWAKAFLILDGLYNQRKLKDASNVLASTGTVVDPPIRKIFVSGSGWSGSGALYDHFQSFRSVLAVDQEVGLIESSPSIASLHLAFKSGPDYFLAELVRFFQFALVGRGSAMSTGEERLKLTTGFLSNLLSQAAKARIAHSLLAALYELQSRDALHEASLCEVLSQYFEQISQCLGRANACGTVLYDNAIHIEATDLTRYLRNSIVFCVQRDPRDQYVDLARFNKSFHFDIDQFAQHYKLCRQAAAHSDGNDDRGNEVVLVEFEKFVQSDAYRAQLVQQAGLRAEDLTHPLFREESSRKNIGIYKHFEDQAAIQQITELLGDYCISE